VLCLLLYFSRICSSHYNYPLLLYANLHLKPASSIFHLNSQLAPGNLPPKTENLDSVLKTKNEKPKTILEIDIHRPDRIIFEGKEVKVTAREFSLLYLLAQHKGKVISYEEILKELWKDEKDADAIYTRINYHICKIRKDILKILDKKEDNVKKMKNIFKTIPGRGLMLNIKDEELLLN